MPLRMKNLKSIINTAALVFTGVLAIAQPQQREKIDGVVGVVGDYVVLDSDIDLEFIQLRASGVDTDNFTRCELFGKLLEDRLYAHQAIQDSIIVSDAEVNSMVSQQLAAIKEEYGTLDEVVKFYNKKNEGELREHFFEVNKMNKLTQQMQSKIIDGIEVTPEEVRAFFKEIPEDEIPTFGSEVEIAQIVIKPNISDEAKQEAIDKLKRIKKEVLEDGSSFYSKVVLNSDDKASLSTGGFYKINRKTPFVKEFKDVAFSLDEGEISEPFETDYGYHIILVEKIRGQDVELRHILIKPKISIEAKLAAKEEIESIRAKILSKEISFSDAAKASSDEKETKNNGGVLYNPRTMESKFELTKMDPMLYNQVVDLQVGEISQPILETGMSDDEYYKIITVNSKTPEHKANYAQDYMKIKDLALKDKQLKAVTKWTDEKINETYIKIDKEFKNCDFANNWLKN